MKKELKKSKAKESKAKLLKKKLISGTQKIKKVLGTKIVPRKKTAVLKKINKKEAGKKEGAARRMEIPMPDMKIEESKFYIGAVAASEPRKSTLAELGTKELPDRYNDDVVVLQIRDPWWSHVYWDLRTETISRLKSEYGADFNRANWVLRSYDVSFVNFNGNNAHRFFDTGVDPDARNWYLNFGSPGTSWCVDLGFVLPDGRFVTVVRSNIISMPLDGPSWVTDEEWMIPDDEFSRLYGLSVGLGPNISSPVGKLWQERLKKDISSGGIVSMGLGSPVKKPVEKRPFWLVVDAELIVYGATEPDADVTVQGRPIKLRKDGTFTLRFALPDGRQDIPVVAKSAHIDETREITPIVTRKTTRNP